MTYERHALFVIFELLDLFVSNVSVPPSHRICVGIEIPECAIVGQGWLDRHNGNCAFGGTN